MTGAPGIIHRLAAGTRQTVSWLRGLCAAPALAVLLGLAPAMPALAHPNIFIQCRVAFLFDGAVLTKFEETWIFDREFSQDLAAKFDRNRDRVFDAAESQAIARLTLHNLAEYRYFTYVWLDGKDLGALAPSHFVASLRDGIVTFTFDVELPRPVDPRSQALKVEVYDREYYAQVDLAQRDPVSLRGPHGANCHPQISSDKQNPYFGYIYPQEITLACR